MKILVLYVFHEYNNRVKSFLEKAVFFDEEVDFMIICNQLSISFDVPPYTNVNVMKRENVGYDNGGWSDALLTNQLYLNYDYFIFANSSVVGPFLPLYYKEKWTTIFIEGLQDNIKLFGSTINTCKNPQSQSHIQSYIFSMDQSTLEFLIQCEIFSMSNYAKTFDEAIWNKEVLMSRKIIENGWNIGCLLPQYNDVDFTFLTKPLNNYTILFYDDLMYEKYRNKLWNEYQLVFVKGNRIPI